MSRLIDSGVMAEALSKEDAADITRLLISSETGGDAAFSLAVERLYPELRRLAGFHAAGGRIASLAATDILHEAFLKLAAHDGHYSNRSHFLAVASRAMRQIIIDYARRKSASKRGGQLVRVKLDEANVGVAEEASALLLINQLLEQLATQNQRAARVFECRFFGGMNDVETSEALDMSLRTVQRDWMKAKAFLSHMWDADDAPQ
ncbi:MAG: ECF-type sigma factor [Pseudomonadales bacterium]